MTKEFEGDTVVTSDSTNSVEKDEETDMTKPVIKEAMSGDLDGLMDTVEKDEAALAAADAAAEAQVTKDAENAATAAAAAKDITKSGDEGAPKTGGSPGNPVVESTTDTGLVALDEGGVPAGFRKEERILKEIVDGKIVEKFAHFFVNDETKEEIFAGFFEKEDAAAKVLAATNEADGQNYTPAEVKLFEAMDVMVKSVGDLKDTIEKQSERITAVEKTADTAKDTAENTVVMSAADNLDESLQTLQGREINKGAAPAATGEKVDLWKGALPMLETEAA